MDNDEVLRGIREALHLEQAEADGPPCTDEQLLAFLDGLIEAHRGPPRSPPPAAPPALDNNLVLKKLRIALQLEESDLLPVFAAGGREVTNRELTPWFRKPGTRHFKPCGDDALRAFLQGLQRTREP